MKLKSLIAIASLALCAQGAMAQPKSRIQAQKDAEKKAETSLCERAKAQYTAQLPAPTDVVFNHREECRSILSSRATRRPCKSIYPHHSPYS